MIFACDLDGVVANLELPIQQAIEQQFGVPIDEQKRDSYYMHDRFNIDPKEMSMFMDELFYRPGFWYSASPILDNLAALKEAVVKNFDADLILITGRKNVARKETELWLKDNLFYHHTVLLMDTLQVKHRAMRYAGCEFMIEDRFDEALTIARKGFRSYLYKTDYNQINVSGEQDNLVWVDSVRQALEVEGLL